MKKFIRMKRRFSLCCVAFMAIALICIPMYIHAEDTVLTYPLYHKHIAGCQTTVYKTISADTTSVLRTVNTDTCSCGGHHDYYDFTASCSCGRTWHTTGHACINSPAGSYQGSCGNYSRINCDTLHSHPCIDYTCGKDERTIIDQISVNSSTLLPAQEVLLKAVTEGRLGDVRLAWGETENLSEITVTENGEYSLYATYKESGIEYVSQLSIKVDNIDHELPFVSDIVADQNDFTSGKIRLSVEAEDAFGLPEEYVSWNGGEYGKDNFYEVSENGNYSVTIKDIAGNTVTKTIDIGNIDKAAPEIKDVCILPAPWYFGNCEITVIAEDVGNGNAGSGLADQAYSFDDGQTWIESNQYELSEPGIVIIKVRDAVGNIAENEIEVVRQALPVVDNSNGGNGAPNNPNYEGTAPETSPTLPIEPSHKENISKADDENKEIIEEQNNQGKEDSTLKYTFLPEPNWKEEVVETQVQEEPLYAEMENNEVEVLENDGNDTNWLLISAISALGLLLLGAFIFFVYILFGMCRIYEVDNRQKERQLGTTGIRSQKKGYSVKVGEAIIHKANSRVLKAKLPNWFVKLAEYKPFKIIVGESVIDKYVEREIDFYINS